MCSKCTCKLRVRVNDSVMCVCHGTLHSFRNSGVFVVDAGNMLMGKRSKSMFAFFYDALSAL